MFQQNILLDLIEIVYLLRLYVIHSNIHPYECPLNISFQIQNRLLILPLAASSPIRLADLCLAVKLAESQHAYCFCTYFWQCNCSINRKCVSVGVCVNYLRLNKHLIFSACVHRNLLSLYIYKYMYILQQYIIIGTMYTPTHKHTYVHMIRT